MSNKLILAIYIITLGSLAFASRTFALEPIVVTTIDPDINTGYGTFQSYNQKVVANQHGIFMTHLHSRNDAYDSNVWRLSRSTDNGATFTTIYESTNGTSAPVIETDSQDNIYLAFPEWKNGNNSALLYKFSPSNNYGTPQLLANIPSAVHGKYVMILDEPRGQLYFFTANGIFATITLSGQIKASTSLFTTGQSAGLQYPLLTLGQNGTLYAAWTTQKNDIYLYWDIHYMLSTDGGVTWQTSTHSPLYPPLVPDQNGPTTRITLDDEFNYHTWLSSFIVKNNFLHFMYDAQTVDREHYLRYDINSGNLITNLYPAWQAGSISLRSLDGFFATNPKDPSSPLFAVSRALDGRLAALVSYDEGATWQEYAASSFNDQNLYSIGGFREITPDGYVVGSYTDSRTPIAVRFFKFKATATNNSTLPSQPGDFNHDGHVNIYDFNYLVTHFADSFSSTDLTTLVANFGK